MKISELMEQIYRQTDDTEGRCTATCDALRQGDPEKEVTKAAAEKKSVQKYIQPVFQKAYAE